jgi:two-component system CheB/CheR fusion protein
MRKARVVADADKEVLLHELEVHEIELEMQNDELRRAREEAESLLARYTEVFDFAPVGYALIDAHGRILEANHVGAELLGMERRKLAGERLGVFVAESDRVAFNECLSRVLTADDEDSTQSCEVRLQEGTRGLRYVNLRGRRIRQPHATALVSMEDTTGRRQAEEAFLEEAGHKDQFLAALSHELRNPLAPIQSAVYLLDHAEPYTPSFQKAKAVIARQAGHLARIVDDLLDITRMAQGKATLRLEPVDLAEVVGQTVEDHRPAFERAGVSLTLIHAPEAAWVDADRTRIVQAFGNLLVNAMKFTPSGGKVEVTLRRDGSSAIISVWDDGMGIAPEVQPHLFQPFRQGPQGIDRGAGGLGLGLAMAKSLVELHRGTVTVKSRGLGYGSTFAIALPLTNARPTKASDPDRSKLRARRVLIVEDNLDAAETLREILSLGGHRIEIAADGMQAIARAKEFCPEVVVCDLGLPGMDGYEVARAIRKEPALSGAMLVALSGYTFPEDVRRAAEAGFDRHLGKPASLEELTDIMAQAPCGA